MRCATHCIIEVMGKRRRRRVKKRRGIRFTAHAIQRLSEPRQALIDMNDVIRACYRIDWIFQEPVPDKKLIEGLVSCKGRPFSIVVVDIPQGVLIITVIGK